MVVRHRNSWCIASSSKCQVRNATRSRHASKQHGSLHLSTTGGVVDQALYPAMFVIRWATQKILCRMLGDAGDSNCPTRSSRRTADLLMVLNVACRKDAFLLARWYDDHVGRCRVSEGGSCLVRAPHPASPSLPEPSRGDGVNLAMLFPAPGVMSMWTGHFLV
jgi:hypothetical protein